MAESPTVPPPEPKGLNSALSRNIAALQARAQAEARSSGIQHKLAAAVTAFTGSMSFVYVHIVIVAGWVAINVGAIPGAPEFDRSFGILSSAASVEAIFLSTFVLISQNRAARAAARRSDLDLQISLTSPIAAHLGLSESRDPELEELKRDVAPETVLDTLERETAHDAAGP